MKGVFSLCCLVFFNSFSFGQDDWDFENTSNTDFFIDTRAVNGHTSEVLESNELEFRITHRFGEMISDPLRLIVLFPWSRLGKP